MDERTQKIMASRAKTAARRATQELRVRELKLVASSLSKSKLEKLDRMFLEAKWLRNSIVAEGVFDYKLSQHGVHVKLIDGTIEARQLTVLPAHVKQTIQLGLQANVKALASARKAGRIAGAIRFTDRVSSLEFPTGDVKILGSKAQIPRIGWVRVNGTSQLGEEIANARLVRRASGYYLLVASLSPKSEATEPDLEPIGLDFGIKTHITTSDAREWNLVVEEPERLKRLQRKLSRQVKGSNNYERTRRLIQLSYEKLNHRKDEAANQLVASLKRHSLVVLQDENLRGWKTQKRRGYGRVIHRSAMGRVKAKLQRLPQTVVVDRFAPTTQLCPECGSLNRMSLLDRLYKCDCGYSEHRDIHAAHNMLLFAQLSPEELGIAPVEGRVPTASSTSSKLIPTKQEMTTSVAS